MIDILSTIDMMENETENNEARERIAYVLSNDPAPTKDMEPKYKIEPMDPRFKIKDYWMLWSYSNEMIERFRKDHAVNPFASWFERVYIWSIKESTLDRLFELSTFSKDEMELRMYDTVILPMGQWQRLSYLPNAENTHSRIVEIVEELKMLSSYMMRHLDGETLTDLDKEVLENVLKEFSKFDDTISCTQKDSIDLCENIFMRGTV